MRIKETSFNGVFLITPDIIKDKRGYFFESFKSKLFSQSSIPITFAQENQSLSKKETFRGLHYQLNFPQGKLISVPVGRVIDFAVDIRKGSPTFGKSESFILDDIMHESLYISEGFAQENQSFSNKGTFRGLHYQLNFPQGKLISVAVGRVVDFVVDIRKGSPTFGKSESFILDDTMHESLYISEGFAHGFYVESDQAVFNYKCTESYHPEDEYGINLNDPELGLNLDDKKLIVSEKDQLLPNLENINKDLLPIFE